MELHENYELDDINIPVCPSYTLVITEHTRKTCQLINLLAINEGNDVSIAVEKLILSGANVCVSIPKYSCDECDDDEYDDFVTEKQYIEEIWDYRVECYPLLFALKHHCHPNVLRVLYEYTVAAYNFDNIMEAVKKCLQYEYYQLFNDSFYGKRASTEGTYHYMLKHKILEYLDILHFPVTLFNNPPKKSTIIRYIPP